MKKGLAIFLVLIICIVCFSFLFTRSVLATNGDDGQPSDTGNGDETPGGGEVDLSAPIGSAKRTNLAGYVALIYNFAVVAGISLAVLVIIFAGYKYMMSSGDPQSLEESKELLVGAIVGLILIFLTRLILTTIDTRLNQFPLKAPSLNGSEQTDETSSD